MSAEEMAPDAPPAQPADSADALPVRERVASKTWKTRMEAFVELAKVRRCARCWRLSCTRRCAHAAEGGSLPASLVRLRLILSARMADFQRGRRGRRHL